MKKTMFVSCAVLMLAADVTLAAGTHAGGHDDEFAFGRPGEPAKASRTVEIEASDAMRYSPAELHVKRGETVRFVIKNTGAVRHEFVLGEPQSLKEHAELMRQFPDMEHAEPNQVSVAPGTTETLVWQFIKAGVVDFACLVPGHFEAGMAGKIAVSTK